MNVKKTLAIHYTLAKLRPRTEASDTAKSAILFHTTRTQLAVDILSTGKLKCTRTSLNESEERLSVSHKYYASFSRSINGDYQKSNRADGYCVIKLDGAKIGNRVKLRPVRYFTDKINQTGLLYDEMEERAYTNKPFIEIGNAILDIEFYVSSSKEPRPWLRKAIILAKTQKIPYQIMDKNRKLVALERASLKGIARPARPSVYDLKDTERANRLIGIAYIALRGTRGGESMSMSVADIEDTVASLKQVIGDRDNTSNVTRLMDAYKAKTGSDLLSKVKKQLMLLYDRRQLQHTVDSYEANKRSLEKQREMYLSENEDKYARIVDTEIDQLTARYEKAKTALVI